jgi:hypothetical protein
MALAFWHFGFFRTAWYLTKLQLLPSYSYYFEEDGSDKWPGYSPSQNLAWFKLCDDV